MGLEYKQYTVGELVERGFIEKPLDGNHGEIHPKGSDFVESGIPFIMASDMMNGRINTTNCKFINYKQAIQLRKGISLKGDVLLSHKATIGRTAIVEELATDFIVLTPQITYYRIKDDRHLNNQYLKYYFDSIEFQNLFKQWAGGGSTRAYLGISAQLKLPIKVFPIEVQKAIAHILSTFDDKIKLNRQMNSTLESMAQAMFKSWFVDFDPVIDNALTAGNPIPEPLKARSEARQALGDKRKPLPQEIQELFPDRFVFSEELGWIPEGWEVLSIDTLIEITGGGTPKTSIEEYWGGTIPWFSVVDAPNQSDVFVLNTEKYITQQGLNNSSTQLLPEGTTIISARGTVGKCALVAQSTAMNQSCYGIRGKDNVSDYFVYYTILLRVADLQQRGHGSVFNTITRDTFKTIKIPFFNADLTSQYDKYVSSLFSKILENCRQSESLSQLRDTLLPKLISGQLRLPDSLIDKFAEQADSHDAEQSISEAI